MPDEDMRSAVKLAFGDPKNGVPPDPSELLLRCISLEGDVRSERQLADSWRKLAGRYDDIRGWLRLCRDDPEGHAEFYKECCLLIFGEYDDETYDGDGDEVDDADEVPEADHGGAAGAR